MKPHSDALKTRFRQGQHAQAIAECEALCRQEPADPSLKRLCASMHALVQNYGRALELLHEIRYPAKEDADILFNIGQCERGLNNFEGAAGYFALYTENFAGHADGWVSLAECKLQLGDFAEGVRLADRALALAPSLLPAWTLRAQCQRAAGRLEEALASYRKANQIQSAAQTWREIGLILLETNKANEALASFTRAIELAPAIAALRVTRGDAYQSLGRTLEAVADYKAALALAPTDDATLKKATLCLLDCGEGDQALELCRGILKVHPGNLTAKLGAEWVLSQLVPLWHVPMMNEPERNQAFHDGLEAVVTPERVVFEIGTGSGLLAMMAARLGARRVFTCEAVGLIARTAGTIIRRNGLQERITVLAKPSHTVQVPNDLPQQADILLHEIFSSELLGEHVLPAIEDAKQRLLKPGGLVLPSAASIMIALVAGVELGKSLHAGPSFGFDLRDFNAIAPKKRPLYREDLAPTLLSEDVEAFRFDFAGQSTFPAEQKRIEMTAIRSGLCYGLIQWIRIELGEGIRFENHPATRRAVANWQHTIYGFDEPVQLEPGERVAIDALHDRSRPWFERAPDGRSRQA